MIINKILNSFFNDKAVFKFDRETQMKYLKKLGNPKDNFERSFFQYKAQIKHLNIFQRIFLNCAALAASFIGLFKKKKEAVLIKEKESALVFVHDVRNVPPKYREGEYVVVESIDNQAWNDKAQLLYKQVKKRYRFHPYFLLKIYKKLSFYCYLIDSYRVKKIITSNEYSFSSSVLTQFCNRLGVEHINVMHGEKLFYFGDAYFFFNSLYVWDEQYQSIFKDLKAEWEHCDVYFPSERFVVNVDPEPTVELTYYLQMQTKKQMQVIHEALIKTGKQKIAVRPHPRYTNINACKSVFKDFEVEDPTLISIEESLKRTQAVVSVFSTVLLQAFCSGIEYFIDDVGCERQYEKLKNLKYRFATEKRLSKII